MLTASDIGRDSLKIIAPAPFEQYWKKCTPYFLNRPNFNLTCVNIEDDKILVQNLKDVILTAVPMKLLSKSETGAPAVSMAIAYICTTPVLPGKFDIEKARALGVPKGPLFGQLKNGQCVTLSNGVVISPGQVVGPSDPCVSCCIIPNVADILEVDTGEPNDAIITESNIDILCGLDCWNNFIVGNCDTMEPKSLIKCMFHYSPESLIRRSDRYMSWMASFGHQCNHIILGHRIGNLSNVNSMSYFKDSSFMASALYTNKLCFGCPGVFPSIPMPQSIENTSIADPNTSTSENNPHIIDGEALMEFWLLPARRRGFSAKARELYLDKLRKIYDEFEAAVGDTNAKELISMLPSVEAKHNYLVDASNIDSDVEKSSDVSGVSMHKSGLVAASCVYINSNQDINLGTAGTGNTNDIKAIEVHPKSNGIDFMGTASAIPSKYRNVTGISMSLCDDASGRQQRMLLDAGEGSWNQMLRSAFWKLTSAQRLERNATELVENLIHSIRVVWISHPHADHHLGLLSILEKKKMYMKKGDDPIVIIAPPAILSYLEAYKKLVYDDINRQIVDVKDCYIPISCRQIDPTDDCSRYSDSYWRSMSRYDPRNSSSASTNKGSAGDVEKVGVAISTESDVMSEKADLQQGAPQIRSSRDVFTQYYYQYKDVTAGLKSDTALDILNSNEPLATTPVSPGSDCANYTMSKLNVKADANDLDVQVKANKSTSAVGDIIAAPSWVVKNKTNESSLLQHARRANAILQSLYIHELKNIRVEHCPQSYGVSIVFAPNANREAVIKVVYSGDTRPCPDLVELGQNATILIHEATFEDVMQEDAIAKCHCTISEAIQSGIDMSSHITLLTHFSQRYTTLPDLPVELLSKYQYSNILPSFDFMSVAYSDLLWCCKPYTDIFYEILSVEKELYVDLDIEDEELTTTKWKENGGQIFNAKRSREEVDSEMKDKFHAKKNVPNTSNKNDKKSFTGNVGFSCESGCDCNIHSFNALGSKYCTKCNIKA